MSAKKAPGIDSHLQEPVPEGVDEVRERLSDALDTLGERVKLLSERHETLRRELDRTRAAREEAESRLTRATDGGLDPLALEEKVRALEDQNDRLSRHAEYLEGEVKSLLGRVRYVLED